MNVILIINKSFNSKNKKPVAAGFLKQTINFLSNLYTKYILSE